MKLKYKGPLPFVRVKGFGVHEKNQIREYPDAFGQGLLDTSKRNIFEEIYEKPRRKNVSAIQQKKQKEDDWEAV